MKNKIIIDIDNTVYGEDVGLVARIEQRMRSFISEKWRVSLSEAACVERRLISEYGSTLAGLSEIQGSLQEDYLDYVHNIEYHGLIPDQRLISAINCKAKDVVFYTNGTRRHALSVLEKVGLSFPGQSIFDIVAAEYTPKPDREAFGRLLAHYDIHADGSVMIDDALENLRTAKSFGLRTVHINQSYEIETEKPEFVDIAVKRISDYFE